MACGHSVGGSVGRCVRVECGDVRPWSRSSEAVRGVGHGGADHQARHVGDGHGVPCRDTQPGFSCTCAYDEY